MATFAEHIPLYKRILAPPLRENGNAVLSCWLEADWEVYTDATLTTRTVQTGDAVLGWRTRLGTIDATRASGNGPLYQAAGLNGKPSLLFESANTRALNVTALATACSGTNIPYYCLMVCRVVSVAATGTLLGMGNTGGGGQENTLVYNTTPNYAYFRRRNTGASTLHTFGTPSTTTPQIVEAYYDGSTMFGRVNGVVSSTAATSGALTVDTAQIGAITDTSENSYADAHISMVVVYTGGTGVSFATQTLWRNYAALKYGIEVTIASS